METLLQIEIIMTQRWSLWKCKEWKKVQRDQKFYVLENQSAVEICITHWIGHNANLLNIYHALYMKVWKMNNPSRGEKVWRKNMSELWKERATLTYRSLGWLSEKKKMLLNLSGFCTLKEGKLGKMESCKDRLVIKSMYWKIKFWLNENFFAGSKVL